MRLRGLAPARRLFEHALKVGRSEARGETRGHDGREAEKVVWGRVRLEVDVRGGGGGEVGSGSGAVELYDADAKGEDEEGQPLLSG